MKTLSAEEKAKLQAKMGKERTRRIKLMSEFDEEVRIYSSSCPNCGRKRAMIGTGRKKTEGPVLNRKAYDEYRCKHCQYSEWRREVRYE